MEGESVTGARQGGRHGRVGLAVVGVACSLITAVGCGTPPPTDAPPIALPAEPLLTTISEGGHYQIEVRTAPQPPVKGVNVAELRVTGVDGLPVDALQVGAVPWMPSHAHGTSAKTLVSSEGDGRYLIENVYLYMEGHWELRCTLDGATGTDDGVVPTFDVR